MGVARHYELVFKREADAVAALTEGLQREPYTGQVAGGLDHRWSALFVTFDADPADEAARNSCAFFEAMAERHGGRFLGLR